MLSLSLDLFSKFLFFHVAFIIFFSIAIFSPYFLQFSLLLQYMAVVMFTEFMLIEAGAALTVPAAILICDVT